MTNILVTLAAYAAEGIIKLIENDSLRNELGKNVRERAKKFSWDGVANWLSQVLRGEVARKKDIKHGMAGV
jgi:glycosyltransferase involved in cell wall biosynthesis